MTTTLVLDAAVSDPANQTAVDEAVNAFVAEVSAWASAAATDASDSGATGAEQTTTIIEDFSVKLNLGTAIQLSSGTAVQLEDALASVYCNDEERCPKATCCKVEIVSSSELDSTQIQGTGDTCADLIGRENLAETWTDDSLPPHCVFLDDDHPDLAARHPCEESYMPDTDACASCVRLCYMSGGGKCKRSKTILDCALPPPSSRQRQLATVGTVANVKVDRESDASIYESPTSAATVAQVGAALEDTGYAVGTPGANQNEVSVGATTFDDIEARVQMSVPAQADTPDAQQAVLSELSKTKLLNTFVASTLGVQGDVLNSKSPEAVVHASPPPPSPPPSVSPATPPAEPETEIDTGSGADDDENKQKQEGEGGDKGLKVEIIVPVVVVSVLLVGLIAAYLCMRHKQRAAKTEKYGAFTDPSVLAVSAAPDLVGDAPADAK